MKVVIIGAGPTGVKVAEVLRRGDFRGRIVMITREPYPPYSPPLMADYLETRGGSELIFWKGKDFCKELEIDCFLGREVVGVVPSFKKVLLKDGEEISYDKLVIASGSRLHIPIRCECEEGEGPFYYNFKSLTAVTELLDEVNRGADRAVVIGAGFIGMEIAITLRKLGLCVLVVEMENRILPRMIPKEIAEPLEDIVRSMGIELLLNSKGEILRGKKRAEELTLSDGRKIEGDLFIAATGVKPNVDFLKDSGIEVRNGIVVNKYLETSVVDVYAGGDVAEVPDIVTGNTYPHAIYPEAIKQGEVIGLNILGEKVEYEGGLNINSLYHFGLPLISEGAMIGEERPDEELIFKGNGTVRKLSIKDGKLLRFELVGDRRGAGLLHTLLVERREIEDIKYDLLRGTYNIASVVSKALDPQLLY